VANKLKSVIIGPGNIGTDLLMQALRSDWFEPLWVVGYILLLIGDVYGNDLKRQVVIWGRVVV